jgi:hypothetical protein
VTEPAKRLPCMFKYALGERACWSDGTPPLPGWVLCSDCLICGLDAASIAECRYAKADAAAVTRRGA